MNGFEPTILGFSVLIITIAEINMGLQTLLIFATLVYTIIKTIQLLKGKNNDKNIQKNCRLAIKNENEF